MTNRRRRTRTWLTAVLATAVLGSCSTGNDVGATTVVGTITRTLPPTATITVTSAAATSETRTEAPSSPSRPITAPTTALGAPTSADCPYFPRLEIQTSTGQRTGRGQVIAASPQPICLFFRSDGGWMAAIRIFSTPDAATAQAAVNERIPIATSSPADQPTGWTGGYQELPDGTDEYPRARSVYGVSKGRIAVIAWVNQDESVKARRIVSSTIERLGY